MKSPKAMYIFLFVFCLSIIGAHVSGNDKFPFVVLLMWFLNSVPLIINIKLVLKDRLNRSLQLSLAISLAILLYVPTVFFLSRQGWIDSLYFIGFR
jgi:hypothetical protein